MKFIDTKQYETIRFFLFSTNLFVFDNNNDDEGVERESN